MQVRCVYILIATVGAATIEADVPHERLPGVHRKNIVQEKRRVPADGPRVVLALYLPSQHPGVGVSPVKIELLSKASPLNLAQQRLPIRVKLLPRPLPRAPAPAAGPLY